MTTSDDDYEVGYGKPPKQHQFKKGQSGNKKGRPKGAKSLMMIVEEQANKKIKLKAGGKTQVMTQRELIIAQLFNKAVKGDPKATQQVLILDQQLIPEPVEQIEDRPLTPDEQAIVDNLLSFKAQIAPEEGAR